MKLKNTSQTARKKTRNGGVNREGKREWNLKGAEYAQK